MRSCLVLAVLFAALPARAQIGALSDPNAKPVEEITVNENRLNKQLDQMSKDSQKAAQQQQADAEKLQKQNNGVATQNAVQAGGRAKAAEIASGVHAAPPPPPIVPGR